jgi:hypothetical protein
MATAQALTAWDAVAALTPLIGTGGFTAIVLAWLAYRKAALEGRRGEPERAGFGFSALLADSSSVEKLVISIDRLALAADKISLLTAESKADFFLRFEGFVDEIRKLRRAVEDLGVPRH